MKKIFLTLAALAIATVGNAQSIEVTSDTPLPIAEGSAYSPVISPTGDYVLVTSGTMKGLQKYDLATGELSSVTTDEGAGYNVKISNDGRMIVYRNSVFKNRLRYNSVKMLDMQTGKTSVLVKDSRNLTAFAAVDGTGLALENGEVKTKRLAGKKISAPAIASISNGNLMLTKDGKTEKFNPKGETRYLWPSVSPDGKKVLFTIPENGITAYVCDIDGNNLTRLGRLSAPKWMGNDWVVGMVDKDNGETITESTIFAVRADGAAYTALTDGSQICLYPSATADASKIVYNTADGKIRLMNVTIK